VNATTGSGTCACNKPGYILSPAHGCVLCTNSSIGGIGKAGDVCLCPPGKKYDAEGGECVCDSEPSLVNANGEVCECGATKDCNCNGELGFVWYQGTCLACTDPLINGSATVDPDVNRFDRCKCDGGSVWTVSGAVPLLKSTCKCPYRM